MASYPYYSPPPPPPPPCNNTTFPILSPPPPPPACNHTTSPTVSPLKSPPPPPACACNKTTPALPPSTLPSSPPSSYYSPPSASLSPPPPPSPPHLSPPSSPPQPPPVLPPPSLPSPPRRTPPSSYSSPQPTPSPPSSESTPSSQSPRKPSKTQASPTPLLQPTTPPPSSSPYPQIHHSPQTPLHSPLSPDPPLCHCVCPSPRATPPNYNSFPPNYYDQIAPGPLFSPSDAPRTAIVTAFVSLGGVFFVAFIAVGLLSIALKKNMLNIPRPRRPNGSSVAGKEVREFQRPGKSPEHKIDVDGSDPDPELSNLQTAATDQAAQALRQTSNPSGDNQGKIDDSGPKSPKPQGEDKIQEADQEKLDKGKQPLEDNTDASPEEESKGGEEDHKKKKWRRLLPKKKKKGSKKEKDKYSGIRQVLNIGSQVVNTGCCFNPHDPEAEEQPENGDKDDKNGDKNVEPGQHSETKNTGSPQHVDEEESTAGKQQSKESMQGNSQGSSGLKNATEKPSSRSGGNKRKEESSIIIQQLNDTVKDGENLNESEPEDDDEGSIPNGSNNGDDNAEKPNAGEKEPDGPHGEPQSDQRDEAKNRDSAGPGEKESNKGEEEPKDSKETLNLPKKKKSRRRRGVKKRTENASLSTGAKRTKEKSTEEGMNVITQDGDNNEDEVPELESEDEDSSEGFISGGSNDEDEKAEEQELDEPHGEPPIEQSESKDTDSAPHMEEGYKAVEEELKDSKDTLSLPQKEKPPSRKDVKNRARKPLSTSGAKRSKEKPTEGIQQMDVIAQESRDGENNEDEVPELESEDEDSSEGFISGGSNDEDEKAEEQEPAEPYGEPPSDRSETKDTDSAPHIEEGYNAVEEESKDSKDTLSLPKKEKPPSRKDVKNRARKPLSTSGAKRSKEKPTEGIQQMDVIAQESRDGENNEEQVPDLEPEDEDNGEGPISGGLNDGDEKAEEINAEEQEPAEPYGEPPSDRSETKDTDSAPHIEEGYNAVEEESKDSKDTLSLPKKEKPPSRKDVKNRARKPLSTSGAKRRKEKPTEGIQQMDVIAQESPDGENNEEQVPDLEPEDEDNGEGSISGGLNDGDEQAELNADEQEPDKLHGEPPSDQSETKDTDSGQHTEEGYNAVEEESRDSKNKVKYPSSSARKKGRKKSFSSNGAKKGNEERSEIFKAYNDTVKDGDNKEEQVLQSEPEDDGEGLFSGGSNNGDEVEVREPELQNDSEDLEVGDSKNDLRWRHARTRESRSREEPLNLELFTSTVGGHEEGSANDSLENEGGKVGKKIWGGKQAPSNTTALNLVKTLTASNVIDDSSEEMKSLGHGGNDYKDDRDKVPGPKFGGSNKDSRGRQRRSQVREEENILEKIGIATTGSGTGKALVSFDDEDDRVKEYEPFASNVDSFFQQPLSSARGIDDQSLNPVTATIDDDKNVELKTLADGDYKGKIAKVHELSKDSRRIKGHTLSVQTVTARMSDDLGKELKSLGGNLEGKSGNGGSNKDVSRSGPTSRGAQQLPNLVQTLTPTNEGDPNPELLEFCEDDKESESEYLDEDMSLQEPSPGDEIELSTEVKEHSEPQDDDGPNNADEDVEFPHVIDETSDERNCKPLCNKSEYEDRKVSQDVDAGKQMLVDSREASFPQKKRHSSRPTGKQEASTVGQVWKAGSYLVEAGQYQDDDADKVQAINESEPQNQYQELESLGSKKYMLGRQVSTRARGKREPLNLEQLISTASTGNDSGRPMVSLDDEEGEVEELGLISSAVGSKQGLSKATALDGQDYKDDKRKLHQLKSRGSSKDLRGPGCSTQVVEGKKPFNLENIVTLASESDPGKAQASVVDEDNNGQVSEPFASEVDSYFPQLGAAARQVEQFPNLFQKYNAASIDDPVEKLNEELKSGGNKGKEAKVPELIINRDSRKADGGVRRIDLRNLNQTVTAKVGKGLEFLGGNQEGKTDKDGSNKDVPWSGQTSRGTQQLPNLVQTSTATNEDDPNPEVEFCEDDEGLESEYLDEDLSQQEPSPVDEIEPSTDDQSEFVTVVNDPEVPQFHNNEHEEPADSKKNAHPGKRLSHPTSSQGGRGRKAR